LARICRVTASGELEELLRSERYSWALDMRDDAARFFELEEESRGTLIEIAFEAMKKLSEEERGYVLDALEED
jgi:hypothetical protein